MLSSEPPWRDVKPHLVRWSSVSFSCQLRHAAPRLKHPTNMQEHVCELAGRKEKGPSMELTLAVGSLTGLALQSMYSFSQTFCWLRAAHKLAHHLCQRLMRFKMKSPVAKIVKTRETVPRQAGNHEAASLHEDVQVLASFSTRKDRCRLERLRLAGLQNLTEGSAAGRLGLLSWSGASPWN